MLWLANAKASNSSQAFLPGPVKHLRLGKAMDQPLAGGRVVNLGVVRTIRVVFLGLGMASGFLTSSISAFNFAKLKQPKLVVIALPPVGEREQGRLFRVIESYVEALGRGDFIPSPGLQRASCEFFNECAAWPQ